MRIVAGPGPQPAQRGRNEISSCFTMRAGRGGAGLLILDRLWIVEQRGGLGLRWQQLLGWERSSSNNILQDETGTGIEHFQWLLIPVASLLTTMRTLALFFNVVRG